MSKNIEDFMKSNRKNYTKEQRAIIEASIANAKSRILSDEKIKSIAQRKEFKDTIERTLKNINNKK